jgi:hypothetical protein
LKSPQGLQACNPLFNIYTVYIVEEAPGITGYIYTVYIQQQLDPDILATLAGLLALLLALLHASMSL